MYLSIKKKFPDLYSNKLFKFLFIFRKENGLSFFGDSQYELITGYIQSFIDDLTEKVLFRIDDDVINQFKKLYSDFLKPDVLENFAIDNPYADLNPTISKPLIQNIAKYSEKDPSKVLISDAIIMFKSFAEQFPRGMTDYQKQLFVKSNNMNSFDNDEEALLCNYSLFVFNNRGNLFVD